MFSELTAGNSESWTATLADNTSAGGWTAKTILRMDDRQVIIDGTASGSVWTFALTSQQSATIAPGTYQWFISCTKLTAREIRQQGTCHVLPDPLASDPATAQLRKDIEAITATITARIKGDIPDNYSIRGQSITKVALAQLMTLKSHLQGELNLKLARARGRQGFSGLTSTIVFARN